MISVFEMRSIKFPKETWLLPDDDDEDEDDEDEDDEDEVTGLKTKPDPEPEITLSPGFDPITQTWEESSTHPCPLAIDETNLE